MATIDVFDEANDFGPLCTIELPDGVPVPAAGDILWLQRADDDAGDPLATIPDDETHTRYLVVRRVFIAWGLNRRKHRGVTFALYEQTRFELQVRADYREAPPPPRRTAR